MDKTLHYNDTVELVFDDAKHHYTIGERTVDGVTSVLEIIAKPALIAWAANKTSEYIDQNLPVGQPIDEIMKMRLVKDCKSAYRKKAQDAADIGTMFHDWVHSYIIGKNPKIPTNEMLKKAVEQFLNWVKERDVKFIDSERRVLSLMHGYCGTCDFIAKIGKKLVLGDIKTSTGIWEEYYLQVSAYAHAFMEEFPLIKIEDLFIIRCSKTGEFEIGEAMDVHNSFQAFLSALSLHRYMKRKKYEKKINQS